MRGRLLIASTNRWTDTAWNVRNLLTSLESFAPQVFISPCQCDRRRQPITLWQLLQPNCPIWFPTYGTCRRRCLWRRSQCTRYSAPRRRTVCHRQPTPATAVPLVSGIPAGLEVSIWTLDCITLPVQYSPVDWEAWVLLDRVHRQKAHIPPCVSCRHVASIWVNLAQVYWSTDVTSNRQYPSWHCCCRIVRCMHSRLWLNTGIYH